MFTFDSNTSLMFIRASQARSRNACLKAKPVVVFVPAIRLRMISSSRKGWPRQLMEMNERQRRDIT